MSPLVEQAIARAGLAPILPARQRGDAEAVRELVASIGTIDLLALGAVADAVRTMENGDVVRIHLARDPGVLWISALTFAEGVPRHAHGEAASELGLLRAVAIARLTGRRAAHIGVDWGSQSLELAQVALGFGATDLTGPFTHKSGALIHEDDLRKVKGQGMVTAAALKRREIAALVRNAGRSCEFTDDQTSGSTRAFFRTNGACLR